MDLFDLVSDVIDECHIEDITLHMEDGYPVLRLRGIRPILRFVYSSGCIFHRHVMGRHVENSRRDGIPLLLCARDVCFYYSDDENFYLLEEDVRDAACRILRASIRGVLPYITTPSALLSRGIVRLMEEYLDIMDEELEPVLREHAIDIARFMGYSTAFLPQKEREILYRFLLFRWSSFHLLYRNSPLHSSSPLLLNPDWHNRRDFVENIYTRYFASFEGFSDMKGIVVSPKEPTLSILSRWSNAPSFTADLNWLLGFLGSRMEYRDLLRYLGFMGGDSSIEQMMSMFITPGSTFVHTGRFSTLPVSLYGGLRERGMSHTEILRNLFVFTRSHAGVLFHSVALHLAGGGNAGKPIVFSSKHPVYLKEDFDALLSSDAGNGFFNMVYDVRDGDEISLLKEIALYGWSSMVERGRMFFLMSDYHTHSRGFSGVEDVVMANTRLNLVGRLEGGRDFFLLMNGNSAHPRSYTKLVRIRDGNGGVDADFAERMENAENSMDDRLNTLKLSLQKPMKVFYYRDSAVDLTMILQRNLSSLGKLFLMHVPVDVWKMLRSVPWKPLNALARIYHSRERCPRLPAGDVPMITRSGVKYVDSGGQRGEYVDFALVEQRDSFRVVDIGASAIVCGGGAGIRVLEEEDLLRWYLNSRIAYFLYRVVGSYDVLPVPDIHPSTDSPEVALARLSSLRGLNLPSLERVSPSSISEREIFSIIDSLVRDVEVKPDASFYRFLEDFMGRHVLDEELLPRLLKGYWKYRFGSLPNAGLMSQKQGGLF